MSESLTLLGENLEAFKREQVPVREGETVQEPAKRLKPIDRSQTMLRPIDVEKLVDEDHVVRGIWSMVKRLDMGRLIARTTTGRNAARLSPVGRWLRGDLIYWDIVSGASLSRPGRDG